MRELSLTNSRLDKRYDIHQYLGKGSYAEVFVARDNLASPNSPHHYVVIKALNVFLQDDLDADLERTLVENFQNEAIALDRVRHPNIISRLGHGTARDLRGTMFHYLVLEYLQGGDLQKATREKAISTGTAFRYIEQVAAGLRNAHRHGIIHRDIKPQNLLLSHDRETVKIADFGVARFHNSDTPITRVGTNIYAPPEHSPLLAAEEGATNAAVLTPAADIYSLAKSVYTLLTGEAPRIYSNRPITELPIFMQDNAWAAELRNVLNKATMSRPELRHQTVDEFWADIENISLLALEREVETRIRPKMSHVPQARVAPGYTPFAPQVPRFDTSGNLTLDNIPAAAGVSSHARPLNQAAPVKVSFGDYFEIETRQEIAPPPPPAIEEKSTPADQLAFAAPLRKRRIPRIALVFGAFLVMFAGGLYAASMYFRSMNISVPEISNPFAPARMGTANTDINLRPEPSANNEPIGVVTRNSRLRIVKIQNNWYQVDVIEQGRSRPVPLPTNRGWLYGRYVDLD